MVQVLKISVVFHFIETYKIANIQSFFNYKMAISHGDIESV